jgi:hypothetical protein
MVVGVVVGAVAEMENKQKKFEEDEDFFSDRRGPSGKLNRPRRSLVFLLAGTLLIMTLITDVSRLK